MRDGPAADAPGVVTRTLVRLWGASPTGAVCLGLAAGFGVWAVSEVFSARMVMAGVLGAIAGGLVVAALGAFVVSAKRS
ncbi:MAG: hypothetical protein HY904_21145 [Deltaproteobacteria bacterium]|nr:hypothetical protein [Deltaproteobacteria bacterium]